MSPEPSPQLYVVLDTNILNRFVTQGLPGCEPEHLEKLKAAISTGKVILLVPEIVELEFEKFVGDMPNSFDVAFEKIDKVLDGFLKAEKVWNEASDIVDCLKRSASEWLTAKTEDVGKRVAVVRDLLADERSKRLPFHEGIMFRSRRRMLAGRAPKNERHNDADVFIIEILLEFFNDNKNAQLIFCCENVNDFAVRLENDKFALHPSFGKELPPNEVFLTVRSLVEFLDSHQQVEPIDPAEVDKAAELQRQPYVFNDEELAYLSAEAIRDFVRESQLTKDAVAEFIRDSQYAKDAVAEYMRAQEQVKSYLAIQPLEAFAQMKKQIVEANRLREQFLRGNRRNRKPETLPDKSTEALPEKKPDDEKPDTDKPPA